MKRRIIWFFITILWLGFIFYNSSRTGIDSGEASSRVVDIFQNILSIFKIKISRNNLSWLVRKGAHFFEFFVLTFFVYNFVKTFNFTIAKNRLTRNMIYSCIIVFSFCFLVAMIDELIQSFIPNRNCSFLDVIIDISGSIFAILIIIFYNRRKIKSSLNKI